MTGEGGRGVVLDGTSLKKLQCGGEFPMAKYVLALDQGTISSRTIGFDHDGAIVSVAQQKFPQIYPAPGLVEHDPEAIWSSQLDVAREALQKAGASASDIAALGITNQRETTILWEKATATPLFITTS